jgi:hypothetical protein
MSFFLLRPKETKDPGWLHCAVKRNNSQPVAAEQPLAGPFLIYLKYPKWTGPRELFRLFIAPFPGSCRYPRPHGLNRRQSETTLSLSRHMIKPRERDERFLTSRVCLSWKRVTQDTTKYSSSERRVFEYDEEKTERESYTLNESRGILTESIFVDIYKGNTIQK